MATRGAEPSPTSDTPRSPTKESPATAAPLDEQLRKVFDFFEAQTAQPWSLATSISPFLDGKVTGMLHDNWDLLGHGDREIAARVHVGIILSFVGLQRKKLTAVRPVAEKILRKAASDEDELCAAFAQMILPFVALDPKDNTDFRGKVTWGPALDYALDKWSSKFKEALEKLRPLLIDQELKFNPFVFKFLEGEVIDGFRLGGAAGLEACQGPRFNIANGWSVPSNADRLSRLKARIAVAADKKPGRTSVGHSEKKGLQRASKVKTLDVTEVISSVQEDNDAKRKMEEEANREAERKKKDIEDRKQAAREKREREEEEKRRKREKAKEEKEARDREKKAAADELRRKRQEEANEIEQSKKRKLEEEAANGRNEDERGRIGPPSGIDINPAGMSNVSAGGGGAPPLSAQLPYPMQHMQAMEGVHYDGGPPPDQQHQQQQALFLQQQQQYQAFLQQQEQQQRQRALLQQQAHQATQANYLPQAHLPPPTQPHPLYQPQQHVPTPAPTSVVPAASPASVPVVTTLPVVTPPVTATPDSHQPSAATIDAVLGPETESLTEEDRQKVFEFLSGRYAKRPEKAEIKLSETVVPDPNGTGPSTIHTVFIILDYEACKWKKIKRKRKV